MSLLRAAFPFVGIALLLSACGGNDDAPDATSTATPPPAVTVTPMAVTVPTSTPLPPTPTPVPPTETPVPTETLVPTETPVPPTEPPPTEPPPAPTEPPAPPTQPPPPPTQPPPAAGPASFTVVAQLLQFSPRSLTVRTGSSVTITMDNRDRGIPHDLRIDGIGGTSTCPGTCAPSFSFVAPVPGTYVFYCSLHPSMNGALTVTP